MRICHIRRFKLLQCLLLVLLGYWFACMRKDHDKDSGSSFNRIDIGFLTDGKNIDDMTIAIKTLFLNRQALDFLTFHVLSPRNDWFFIDQIFQEWSRVEIGLHQSFNYSLYDLAECQSIQTTFEPYFDAVYRTAFCKLIFPYIVDPQQTPYLLLLDFDIVIMNNRFTKDCWLHTITELETDHLALFSIAHQGSPLRKNLPFPMPFINEYNTSFHFNNGIVLFHVARIHALDRLEESSAYPISKGPQRWLRDMKQVSLDYLEKAQTKYSLTQVIWNLYMSVRPHCFVQLNQGCNFQSCADRTNVQMRDISKEFPTIIIVHFWRACLKQKAGENDFFISYYNTLTRLPIAYVNRINPTGLFKT